MRKPPRDGSAGSQNQLDTWLHSSVSTSFQKRNAAELAAQHAAQMAPQPNAERTVIPDALQLAALRATNQPLQLTAKLAPRSAASGCSWMHKHLIAQHPTQVTAQLAAKKITRCTATCTLFCTTGYTAP